MPRLIDELVGYIVLAAIYQYLPLRKFAYGPFRADVDERLRLRMVAISGLADNPVKLSSDRVCNVFYWLIDNDNSLGKRAGDVRFNGAMMTSFPDLTAVFGLLRDRNPNRLFKIFLSAYRRAAVRPASATLIYCDTGVENPVLDAYVKTLFGRTRAEFEAAGLPIGVRVLKAPVEDRFFVRLIGRGYLPPTTSFRWCTTGLRIRPVSQFIRARLDACLDLGKALGGGWIDEVGYLYASLVTA